MILTPYVISPSMKLPEDIREYFRKQGAVGGKTRAANLSPEERREIARKAVQSRWEKSRKKSGTKKAKKTRGGK